MNARDQHELLERMLAREHERVVEDGDFDSQDLDMACGDAYRKGDLITSATHDRAIADAVKAERERCSEMRRFIVAAMTHLRDNGDLKARDELLAWGARALAAQDGGDAD